MTKSRTLRRAGAVVLSLAMAVSTLFIAPDSLAASNPKLSKTSVSVYVGKKKTIKIKLTKAQKKQLKSVSVKMTSAQKKKAKVSASKKTLKVTITGKKKGTVKNAKVVLKFKKKVNKKKTWTLKIKKITVKNGAFKGTKKKIKSITASNGVAKPSKNFILLRNNPSSKKKQTWTLYDRRDGP